MGEGGYRFAIPIIVALVLIGFAKLCHAQAVRPARRDVGGKHLSPGFVNLIPLVGCGVAALLALYYWVFVGINPSRPDYNSQIYSLYGLIVGFGGAFCLFLYLRFLHVRWDDEGVERTLPGLGRTFIRWGELIGVDVKKSNDVVLRSADGQKIRFSTYMPGGPELLVECQTRLANNSRPSTTSRTVGVT